MQYATRCTQIPNRLPRRVSVGTHRYLTILEIAVLPSHEVLDEHRKTARRAVLARDPEWDLAAAVSIVAVSLIPGTLIAAIVPCELRARLGECEGPRPAARIALRLMGIMTLGGIAGSFGSEPVSRLVGVEGLVLVGAALLLGSALAARRLPACAPRRLETGLGVRRGAIGAAPVRERVGAGRVWR